MRIRTEELSAAYRKEGPPVLERITMEVPEGRLYAVLGPNGSGKSTLMRAILGLLEPRTGEVWIHDRPVGEWTRRELALRIGVVPQWEEMPFPVSVRELVAMGRYPHLGPLRTEGPADREAVQSALDECAANDLANRPANQLSGGELQRVRIARALAQEPEALVLDEPTASLDIRHEMGIFRLLRRAADQGRTVLLVTHNLSLAARFADRILLLNCGRTVGEGPPAEVLRREVVEEVYEWPVDVQVNPKTGSIQVVPLSEPWDQRPEARGADSASPRSRT